MVEKLWHLAETEHINEARRQVRCVRGDCEFINNELTEVVKRQRIRLENTTPHAHKKGAGETVAGHISRLARSIMSGCNPRYWSWAIHHAAFIWNHSQRQDQDVLPPAVRLCEPESAHRSNVVAFSRSTPRLNLELIFVLKVNRAKRERFNMNSVRAEGMYLGVNLRQRGMIVKVGSGIYIRSNVVAKPKEQKLEGDGNEQERHDDDDDAEEDGDNDSSDDEKDDDAHDDAKDQDESTSINHDTSDDDSENDIDAEDDAEDQEVSVSVHYDTGDDEDDYDSNDSDDDGSVDNVNHGSGVSVTWEEG